MRFLCVVVIFFALLVHRIDGVFKPMSTDEALEEASRKPFATRPSSQDLAREVDTELEHRRDFIRLQASMQHVQREPLAKVRSARLAAVDYDAVRRWMPILAMIGVETDAQIDRWLLDNCARVTRAQLAGADESVQGDVGVDLDDLMTGYRPPHYGRATSLLTSMAALGRFSVLEVKGVGVAPGQVPLAEDHKNGLLPLAEALREYVYQRIVDVVLADAYDRELTQHRVRTTPQLAVIDYGFDVNTSWARYNLFATRDATPAGAVVRRTYGARYKRQVENNNDARSARIERLLRRYGLTSGGAYWNVRDYVALNVQMTHPGVLVDFGGYAVADRFDRPTTTPIGMLKLRARAKQIDQLRIDYCYLDERTAGPMAAMAHSSRAQLEFNPSFLFDNAEPDSYWRGHACTTLAALDRNAMSPDDIVDMLDPAFVQPDAKLQLPMDVFGPAPGYELDSTSCRIFARIFHMIDHRRDDLRAAFAELLDDVLSTLRTHLRNR
jgi:hypothetical protein